MCASKRAEHVSSQHLQLSFETTINNCPAYDRSHILKVLKIDLELFSYTLHLCRIRYFNQLLIILTHVFVILTWRAGKKPLVFVEN